MGRLVSESSIRMDRVAGLMRPMRMLSSGSWMAPWRVAGESGEVDGDVLGGKGLLDEGAHPD